MVLFKLRVVSKKSQKMARYKYIRSSTKLQNNQYQKSDEHIMFIDFCSGATAFAERENGSKLLSVVKAGDTVQFESLDRGGRNALDLLNTLEFFKKKKVNVEIKNLGVCSMLENGKSNPAFEIISSVLGIIHQQMRENLLEVQKKGIAVAKAKGDVYKGRKRGTVIPRDKYLAHNKKAVSIIKKHPDLSLRKLAILCDVSYGKVKKIKEML